MVSELRRGAAAGGTWAIYILVSTPPMDLSPADFIFHQSLSRRLSTSMQCIGDQEPTENQLRRTGGIPIKGQGAQAAACSIYFDWPQSTLELHPTAQRHPHAHPPSHPASHARLTTLPAAHPRQSARPRRVSHPLILHPRAHSSLVHRPDYLRCRLAACACPQAAACLKLASLSSFSWSRFLANGAGITSPH
jgi:hypothetical protein